MYAIRSYYEISQSDGTIAYSRAGSFKLDNSGQIVTADGLRMEPNITIPPDSLNIAIDPEGTVSVTQAGATAPTVVGTIQTATFQNEAGLQALGFNLFRETDRNNFV